jgi:hypothetical protein
MKYFFLLGILMAILIIAGCVGEQQKPVRFPAPETAVPLTQSPVLKIPSITENFERKIPLTMIVDGNLNYTKRDVLKLSGTSPHNQLLMVSLTDSSGTIFMGFPETDRKDGTWSGEYDLRLMNVSTGQATVLAGIVPGPGDTNIPRPSEVIINISR